MSIASIQEARLREEMELGRASPRAAVVGRFGELAIRGEQQTEWEMQDQNSSQTEVQNVQDSKPGDKQMNWPAHEENVRDADIESRQLPKEAPKESQSGLSTPPASSPRKKSTPSRKQATTKSPSKNRKIRFSPPPEGSTIENPFTWHDHEITGHEPSDPTDDGYGINGIGFKPTAAMAWARSQKRQKQVSEWKTREAREAREKRRERRDDGANLDSIHSIRQGSIQKRVKFDV